MYTEYILCEAASEQAYLISLSISRLLRSKLLLVSLAVSYIWRYNVHKEYV